MLTYCPSPYPDELLYSLMARLQERQGVPHGRQVLALAFGSAALSEVVSLPSHLGAFIRNVPPGHGWTVDGILANHTLFPYFAPFGGPEHVAAARRDVEEGAGASARMRLGATASRIGWPRRLRRCLACVVEDRHVYGET